MLFSSIPFIYYFLVSILILYFLMPSVRAKNMILLVFSLAFYGWGEPKYLILMILSVGAGYFFGLLIEKAEGKKRKNLMWISVTVSLAFLVYFKYADFFIGNFNAVTGLDIPLLRVSLPIGISFYTFQIVSYTIDVYRGDVRARKNPLTLALYISMFPQLIAGPIVRYSDIETQLDARSITVENISFGIRRFVIGLGKKILIANVLGELCDVFKNHEDVAVLYFWLYAVAYSLHIYFDFSGYSDMAIGLGKILGFDFLENFNYPFISKSITEFWRRWHMSLGTWFRDYVYIPMGGNRVSTGRHVFNILVVWFLTGFWHGADWNFIIWGLYFGVILIIEKNFLARYLKNSSFLSRVYVIPLMLVSFVIFSVTDMGELWYYLKCMFGLGGIPLVSEEFLYYLSSYSSVLIIALVGSTPIMKDLVEKLRENRTADKIIDMLEPVFLLFVAVMCTAYLVDGAFNPFLYFRF